MMQSSPALTVELAASFGLSEQTLRADSALLPIAYYLFKRRPPAARSAADQKAGKPSPQGKEIAGEPEVVPEGAMTVQEAEKMLQSIRDQEMIRRLKRQAAERNQHVPVDRDW